MWVLYITLHNITDLNWIHGWVLLFLIFPQFVFFFYGLNEWLGSACFAFFPYASHFKKVQAISKNGICHAMKIYIYIYGSSVNISIKKILWDFLDCHVNISAIWMSSWIELTFILFYIKEGESWIHSLHSIPLSTFHVSLFPFPPLPLSLFHSIFYANVKCDCECEHFTILRLLLSLSQIYLSGLTQGVWCDVMQCDWDWWSLRLVWLDSDFSAVVSLSLSVSLTF